MNKKTILAAFAAVLISVQAVYAAGQEYPGHDGKGIREVLKLRDKGMVTRSGALFNELARKSGKTDPEGYALLNDVLMQTPGYVHPMEQFLTEEPQSVLIPQII